MASPTEPTEPRPAAGPELVHPVAVDRIGERSTVEIVRAPPDRLAPIARRLQIPAVLSLEVRFELRRTHGRIIAADGVLSASVTRDCVVTLEPFEQRIEERFEVEFVPAEQLGEAEGEDPEAPDRIGYEGGALDLGEAAIEQLALSLDPFPRRPEADLDAVLAEAAGPSGADGAPASVHPFADLAARLRRD